MGSKGVTRVSEAELGAAAVQLDGVTSIAVIDDAFESLSPIALPAHENDAVMALLADLKDPDVAEDFAENGVDEDMLNAQPYLAIDALTAPGRFLGDAHLALSAASETLGKLVSERHAMRGIVDAMRKASGCEVVELRPGDGLDDVQDKQLVFIDYFLEKDKADGSLAEEIAGQIEQARDPSRAQQIILMSSATNVRSFRRNFRRSAGIQGSAFSFVAKEDLDEPWKVRAHLKMFAGALPHSQSIGEYIASAKERVGNASDRLIELLDDLDLGDFAYIQKLSLQADGHPLGHYLSWLFSTHLAALAFEYELREQQSKVDKLEFDEMFISPVEPSTIVAAVYHDALFERNVGRLGPHPREAEDGEYRDVPLVGLGDVFFDVGRTKAVVILSADCDLAFAPNAERSPDRDMPVLVVEGVPHLIDDADGKSDGAATEGVRHGSDVYRIDWSFKTYRTIPLGELEEHLLRMGVDVSGRDRLRPLYALKLQNEFGRQILRPGHPVMPPLRKGVRGEVWRSSDGVKEVVDKLDDLRLSSAFEEKGRTVRVTPALAGRLQGALGELHEDMKEKLANAGGGEQADGGNERRPTFLRQKVDAIARVLDDDEKWIALLGDSEVPGPNTTRRVMHGVYIAQGKDWQPPQGPAIVFQVIDT